MTRQIHLKTTMVIPGLEEDPVVLPEDIRTIRSLLNDMAGRIQFKFLDPKSGDLKQDLEIIVNGKDIWFYPKGLDTQIQDDDVIEIYMVPLGGG